MRSPDCHFRFLILTIFAGWFGLVSLTDTMDFLVVLGILPDSILMTSHNFTLVEEFLNTYCMNQFALSRVLYVSIISWTLLTFIFFSIALVCFCKNPERSIKYGYLAFWSAIALLTTFLFAAEIFLQYAAGHVQMDRLTFMLLCYFIYDYLVGKRTSLH